MGRSAAWLLALAAVAMLTPCRAVASDAAWNAVKAGGVVALIRHARAPGTGDPANFRLDDCATQRNLSETGRVQARRIGEAFRERGVRVDRVLSSAWCRSRETAHLAFGQAEVFAPLNSFFRQGRQEAEQTRQASVAIAAWRGPGVLVLVTHQVNITALTREFPEEGEILVLQPNGSGFALSGKITANVP
jgi:phosphohistidine phosphatase SixA